MGMIMRHLFIFVARNVPPKANAGGDQIIVAPIAAVILNGSQSSDDLKVAQWLWTREPTSLAIGSIVEGTDKSSVLMVSKFFIFNHKFYCLIGIYFSI